jgi:peroxiredoxin
MIRKFDVAYFMISVDTLEDNKGFAEKEHADFPLLANPDKKVALAYGVVSPRGAGRFTSTLPARSRRSTEPSNLARRAKISSRISPSSRSRRRSS